MKPRQFLKTIFFYILCTIAFLSCGKKDEPSAPVTMAPAKIKDLTALPQGKAITLSWSIPQKNTYGSALSNLKGFKILRSEKDFEDACIECPKRFLILYDIDYKTYMMNKPHATRINYSDRDLQFKKVYTYNVVSYTSDNQPSRGSNAQEVFWDLPSLSPKNCQAELKDKSVVLMWEEPPALEDGSPLKELAGYNLYRRLPGEDYPLKPINSELITTLACRDKGIETDRDYYYMIRAVRKIKETFIESEECKEVIINTTDRTPPDAPTGLIAIPTQGEIMLKWNENKESDLKGYILYRKSAGEADFKRLLTPLLTRASYLDRSATREETYTYAVTAIDDARKANESEFSEEVTLEYHY